MAENVVSFFLEKLYELITREANLLAGVDEQIKDLRDELEWIRSFLKDADAKRKDNYATRIWVNQVRGIAYDAEDVIDEFLLKIEHERRRAVGVGGCLRSCLTLGGANQLKTRHNVGNQIENIKRRVDKIFENKSKYGIELKQLGESSNSMNQQVSSWQQRSPMVEEVDVVGFENEAKELVTQLTKGETEELRVISIVGMGGLGKTTLAKRVYNNDAVSRHFHCRVWIYLSQEYIFRVVLMEIVEQLTGLGEEEKNKLKKMNDYEVGSELLKHFKERKFFVVIDDIWSTDAWDRLKTIFQGEAKGSRIILTTRNTEVANLAHENNRLKLRFLKEDESMDLFRKKVLSNNVKDDLPTKMVQKGKKIVAKCGGLPLAVIVLGGFLSRRQLIPSEWEKALKGINWQMDEGRNQISQILSLSYNDLPYFLKSCFLYLSVFPEDYEIPARKLIWLWVAEGLVQQRGNGTMEEVAEDYLEELVGRSMVQVSKRRSNGSIKTCRIHDLLRDLSISEAKEVEFLNIRQSAEFVFPARARRLTIHGEIDNFMSLNHLSPHLRSLLWFGPYIYWSETGKEYWRMLPRRFRLLRVLDLSNLLIEHEMPAKICEMIHLRYLRFGFVGVRTYLSRCTRWIPLPSNISNLFNLQTLDIGPNSFTKHVLPVGISKMDQLRHLNMGRGEISGRFKTECLRNLQTLSSIKAGRWIEDGLARLTNLRKLGIHGVLKSHKEALSNSILKLHGLQSLSLMGEADMPSLMLSNHVHLYKLKLEGRLGKLPEFPPNLTQLSLRCSELVDDPMATLEKLTHLKILYLDWKSFMGKKMRCSASGFSQLEKLVFVYLNNFEERKIEERAMSSLRRLEIMSCKNLKMLPEGLQHVTTLQTLELSRVSKELKSRIDKENGEDWYKVQNVPSLFING